jgi:hypothetical protein
MKLGQIRFDDPADLSDYSRIHVHLMMQLGLLDYARRVCERKGDKSSLERAEEIRKLYKKAISDCTFVIRAVVPDDISSAQCKMWMSKVEQDMAERVKTSGKERKQKC